MKAKKLAKPKLRNGLNQNLEISSTRTKMKTMSGLIN